MCGFDLSINPVCNEAKVGQDEVDRRINGNEDDEQGEWGAEMEDMEAELESVEDEDQ